MLAPAAKAPGKGMALSSFIFLSREVAVGRRRVALEPGDVVFSYEMNNVSTDACHS